MNAREPVHEIISGPNDDALDRLIADLASRRTSIISFKMGNKKVTPLEFKILACKHTNTFASQAKKDCDEFKRPQIRVNITDRKCLIKF